MSKRCANCGKELHRSEIAAQYNDNWFACEPCWDKSWGFLGWQDKPMGELVRGAPILEAVIWPRE